MPNRERYAGKNGGPHRRLHRRQDSDESDSYYSGSFSNDSSDAQSAATGPLSALADGLLEIFGTSKKTKQQDIEDVADESIATSQDHRRRNHNYNQRRRQSQPRGRSRPRRRDDGSVLSGISDATKIRSGVLTKEPIAVCSTTAYGSDFLPTGQGVSSKKGYFLRSGAKPSQSGNKGKKNNGKKTGTKATFNGDESDVSIFTESPMPINVPAGYASKQWSRKFDEKRADNIGPQRVQVGENGAVIYTPASKVAGKKRHYYMGMKSTKKPLGKKPDPKFLGRHSMLSDTLASEVTSHHLNSLPSQSFSILDHAQKSYSTVGNHQDPGLHRYGNYSLPDVVEEATHDTATTDGMESVASSICSKSVRIKTKRRGAETNEVELEMLIEEESLSGSSSGSTCSEESEFSVSVVGVHEEDEDEDEVKFPVEVNLFGGDESIGTTSTSSSASSQITSARSKARSVENETTSTSSSASSQITSARSKARSVKNEEIKNGEAPLAGDKCNDAPAATNVDVRSDDGSRCQDDSGKNSKEDLDEAELPLPQASKSDVYQCKGGADECHVPKETSNESVRTTSTSSTSSMSTSQDTSDDASRLSRASNSEAEKAKLPKQESTRPPLPPCRRKSNASQPSPRPNSTKSGESAKKKTKKEKKEEAMKRVELDVLGPVNSPMQLNTNCVHDKEIEEKKPGLVKETVSNMLEAAFSPDGENFRTFDQNNQKGRTFRPKIPFLDSMTSSDESEQSRATDWADVESWCSSVQENSTEDVSRWQRQVKYPSKKNKKGWYAKPVEEIKNKHGYEVGVVHLGLKKGGKDKTTKDIGKGKNKKKQNRKMLVQHSW